MTAICTITGGLAAVIYTDTLQAALMIIGATGLSAFAFARVGGLSGLMEAYPHSYPYNGTLAYRNDTCGLPPDNAFQVTIPIRDGKR